MLYTYIHMYCIQFAHVHMYCTSHLYIHCSYYSIIHSMYMHVQLHMYTSKQYALGSGYYPVVVKYFILLGVENIPSHFILQKP